MGLERNYVFKATMFSMIVDNSEGKGYDGAFGDLLAAKPAKSRSPVNITVVTKPAVI